MARSAHNTEEQDKNGFTVYRVDTGDLIKHHPDDGAVALAIKMLRTIKEGK